MFLFIGQKNFKKKFRLRVYVPFYKMKNFLRKKILKKNSEEGGCLEMGCVEGDGGLWMVKQGYKMEGLTVATLRDVRLFRCKRFEGCLSSEWKEGTD